MGETTTVFCFGNYFQPPPIDLKGIQDKKDPILKYSTNFVGVLTFKYFINRPLKYSIYYPVVIMDNIILQTDLELFSCLDRMQNTTTTIYEVKRLLRQLDKNIQKKRSSSLMIHCISCHRGIKL